MPPTAPTNSAQLSIELLDPSIPSFPGSVIRGLVIRKAPLNAASATVRVRLQGRAKAKLKADNGNSRTTYRSRFPFWGESDVSSIAHQGAIIIGAKEEHSWEFSLKIPTDVSQKTVNGGVSQKQKQFYYIKAPLGAAADIPAQPLPATFHDKGSSFTKDWHGYVEFWIEAVITVKGDKNKVGKSFTALLPIRINSKPPPWPPISDFGLSTRTSTACVSSHRLVPGKEQDKPSFKQKTQKLFGSSKVPSLYYTVEQHYPAVIQMGNPSCIPFSLRATPNWDRTSKVLENTPQLIKIKSVVMEIETTTSIVCPGTLDTHSGSKSSKTLLARINPTEGSLVINCGSDEEPLHLGAMLGVKVDGQGRLTSAQTDKPVNPARAKLAPSYLTYCIKVEHSLLWEVKYEIAGEPWAVSGRQQLQILPPSLGLLTNDQGQLVVKEGESVAEDILGFLATGLDIATVSLDAFGLVTDVMELLGS